MIFEPQNDLDYHDWLDANPSGLVLGSDKRRTNPNYPMLHGSLCAHINDKNWPNYTTAEYMKVCSMDRSELDEWVKCDGRGMQFCKDSKSRNLSSGSPGVDNEAYVCLKCSAAELPRLQQRNIRLSARLSALRPPKET